MEDNRFSTMMPKGINTYDATATAEDIAQGKTAYVAGQKITGTAQGGGGGGGDYSDLGIAIDVEAETIISKGSKIIGRLNDQYVTRNLVSNAHNLTNLLIASDDLSVAVCGSSTSDNTVSNGYTYTFYFRNEQTGLYENSYQLTIENYPSTLKCNPGVLINEQGTLAITSTYDASANVCIIFEIDKENYTVSYSYESFFGTQLPVGGTYVGTYYCSLIGFDAYWPQGSTSSNGYGGLIDNILIVNMKYNIKKIADDTTVSSNEFSFFAYKYENGELSLQYYEKPYARVIPSNVFSRFCNMRRLDENNILFSDESNGNTTKIGKYNILNKTLSYNGSVTQVKNTSSKDGRYWCNVTRNGSYDYTIKIYELNADLSLTLIRTANITSHSGSSTSNSAYNAWVNDDGSVVYDKNGFVYNLTDLYMYMYVNSDTASPLKTNTFNDKLFLVTKYFKTLSPATEAQYLISTATSDSCSTADRIYGVASQDLAVGVRGEARGLFNTF